MTTETKQNNWCWYTESGHFYDDYASSDLAIRGAIAHGLERRVVFVGTTERAMDAIARQVDAHEIAEGISDALSVEDLYIGIKDGGQEALKAWALEYLEADMCTICVDGETPSEAEWVAAGGTA